MPSTCRFQYYARQDIITYTKALYVYISIKFGGLLLELLLLISQIEHFYLFIGSSHFNGFSFLTDPYGRLEMCSMLNILAITSVRF